MKTLVITHQSLGGRSFEMMMKMIPALYSHGFHSVYFYKDFERQASDAGAEYLNNYNSIVSSLERNGINILTIPVYGPDELFYMLNSKSFCKDFGFTDKIYFSPSISWSTPYSADLLGYKGQLYVFEKAYKSMGETYIEFKEFDYKVFKDGRHWVYSGLDTFPLDVPEKDIKIIKYSIDGKSYTEQFKKFDYSAMKNGAEGYVYQADRNPGYVIKIYWAAVRGRDKKYHQTMPPKYTLSKIDELIEYCNGNNLVAPAGKVYSEDGKFIGYIMKKVEGESVNHRDLHNFKYKEEYIKQLLIGFLQCEVIGVGHRDCLNNTLFDTKKEKLHILDIISAEYGTFPATCRQADSAKGFVSCASTAGTPQAYRDSINNDYFSLLELSYQAFYMLLNTYCNTDSRYKPPFFQEDKNGITFINPRRNSEITDCLVKEAAHYQYNHRFPCHFARILNVIEGENTFSDVKKYIEEIGISPGDALKPTQIYNRKKKKITQNFDTCSSMPEERGYFDLNDEILRGDYPEWTPDSVSLAHVRKEKTKIVHLEKHQTKKGYGNVRSVDEEETDINSATLRAIVNDDTESLSTLKLPKINFREIREDIVYLWALIVTTLLKPVVRTHIVNPGVKKSMTKREQVLYDYEVLKNVDWQTPVIMTGVMILMLIGCVFIFTQIKI